MFFKKASFNLKNHLSFSDSDHKLHVKPVYFFNSWLMECSVDSQPDTPDHRGHSILSRSISVWMASQTSKKDSYNDLQC